MLLAYYLFWHYTSAPMNFLRVWGNMLWFVVHFFSLPILLRTLFQPIQRLSEEYQGGLDLEDLGQVIVVNTLMRILGVLVRSFFIVLGVAFLLLGVAFGAILFVAWFFLPLILSGMVVFGFALLFS